MQYFIKQKVFSLKDKFNVVNGNQETLFQVEGKMFSLRNKLNLMDPSGATLFTAQKKLFKIFPEYIILSNDGTEVARVKRKFSILTQKYDVFEGNNEMDVEGNFLGHSFQVNKNGRIAASIIKKYLSFGDSYVIDVEDENNAVLYLFIVIIIDQIAQAAQRNRSNSFND